MALQSISHLFQEDRRALGREDVGYMIERFLREQVRSDAVYCKAHERGGVMRVRVRTGSAALAEAVLVRDQDIRDYVQGAVGVSLGDIRVVV